MKCPYRTSRLKHIEQTSHNLIDEETGVSKGSATIITEDYEYCDCLKEECAVYYEGKCHYGKN